MRGLKLLCRLLLGCCLMLAGCGREAPTITAVSIPQGWQSVKKNNVSFALPPGWEVLATEDANFGEAMDELVRQNPRLQPVATQARTAVASGQVQVLAFDLSPEGVLPTFTTNLSIGRQEMPRAASLDDVAEANQEQLRANGFREIERGTTTTGGEEVARLSSTLSITDTLGEELPLAFEQYILVEGRQQWVLTFATIAEQRQDLRPTFERIVGTFRVE